MQNFGKKRKSVRCCYFKPYFSMHIISFNPSAALVKLRSEIGTFWFTHFHLVFSNIISFELSENIYIQSIFKNDSNYLLMGIFGNFIS